MLETVEAWATRADDAQAHIFWLNGLAGIGKSTIAVTIAEWAASDEVGILGGSFFFARDVEELSSPAHVFPTLAFQLAQFDKRYKLALYDALQKDKLIASAKLTKQFDQLIRAPISVCQQEQPILIVLDALDECSPEGDVREMLHILLHSESGAAVVPGGPKLRILIASRPEAHIEFIFKSPDGRGLHERVVLHDIEEKLARDDIKKYFTAEFARMRAGSRDLGMIPMDWPSPGDLNKLLDRCGMFFAYAATVIRYIGDEGRGAREPVRRLDQILCLKDVGKGTNPYLALDELYLGVLRLAAPAGTPEEHVASIRCVLATVICLREPLSISDLAAFLSTTSDGIRKALYDLHSVVLVPDDHTESVRFFHQSFPDFIKSKKRCADKRFFVDVPTHEDFMASRCMDANGSTYVFDRSLAMTFYTADYWSSHIQSGTCHDLFEDSESEKGPTPPSGNAR